MALDSTPMTGCPGKGTVRRLLGDALPPAEREPLEAHIEACAACQHTLERLTSEPLVETSRPTAVGEEVPGYDILARLGQGGMGVVYKARHRRLGRLVALKRVRSGRHASAAELSRFRTEAHAAARLQHPNIVQVFEVGEADGQPFLAMEYVEGESLDRLVTGAPWPALPAARLAETLARAIDAAHQQGVVHRDLKPANVLVSGEPVRAEWSSGQHHSPFATHHSQLNPKIADFGLAKVLEGDSRQTESGIFLGTPSYAAPEQAAAHQRATGPHTDIYALGAILYELLTGRPPFRGATPLETIDEVLHREPVSLRLLNHAVPPDLEAICLMCLEKSPARRYHSAAALAEDLRAWQHHEPVQARRPGPLGRAARWCQRHPALTAIAAIIVLALCGIGWQWREAVHASELADARRQDAEAASILAKNAENEAEQARRDAVEEAAAAREVADFLGGLFEQADPFVLTGRVLGEQPNTQPTALDIVDRGARRLADTNLLREKPLARAGLLDKVGHVYLSLGEGAKAAPFVLEALELRRKHLPAVHPDLASSLHNAGFLQLTKGNFKTSEALFTDALAMRNRLFGARSPQAMTSRFHLAFVQGMLPDRAPEPLLLEVLESQRGRLKAAEDQRSDQVGKEALECTFTLLVLCNYYAIHDQFSKLLPYMAEATRTTKKITNKDVSALFGHFIRFRQWQALGQTAAAEESLRQALAVLEKHVGRRHYLYVALQREAAYLYFNTQRYQEAEKAFLELEENYRTVIGGDGVRLAEIAYDTAVAIRHGQFAQALGANDQVRRTEHAARIERYARTAYDQAKQCGVEQRWLGVYVTFLAEVCLYIRSEPDNTAGEEFAREGVRIRNAVHGAGHELTDHPRRYLLVALLRQNRIDELENYLADLLAREPNPRLGENSGTDAWLDAARALARAGKSRLALLVLEQAIRAGHDSIDRVRSDPAFASLRESEDYRHLLKKLSK